ncbi:OLC1v1017334C1 [Oldenlandia corymbosa var. corymbosa]|uniref:OLC1v1017334C1 n=1 Tax=Oldenlandia corymbosa var. corymbosa TaxID=529605 RepID=A0AAV1E967_OLDCO|nr:OLC1v1017334C1 [Oldenlandia corymbosa var. corymbosa]
MFCSWRTVTHFFELRFLQIKSIRINKPERRNSFKPQTVKELTKAFNAARDDIEIGVIIFNGTLLILCKNGHADYDNFGRLDVLDLQVQIRRLPKPVIATYMTRYTIDQCEDYCHLRRQCGGMCPH